MRIRAYILLVFLVAVLGTSFAQPKLVVSKPSSYLSGDSIDPATFVLDVNLEPVKVLDLIGPDTKVVVLVFFGGAALSIPDEPFRGPLWCEDSFDDLAVQRALVSHFKGAPVQFIPIVIPPVYSNNRYGYEQDVFLANPDESPAFQAASRAFIENTEKIRATTLIPFDRLYFDPKNRLCQNRAAAELGENFGEIFAWQGKLRWHRDPRKYGVPTMWILDSQGKVLTNPFWGNDYDSDPPSVHYGFAELKDALTELLEQAEQASDEQKASSQP